MIHLTTQLIQLHSTVYYQALAIPAKSIKQLLEETPERRVIVTIKDGVSWHAALMPDGAGDYFINVSKEMRKKAGIQLNDAVEITLEADRSEYGMPLPDEVAELWSMDPEAREVFHRLTPGKQRSLLYLIAKPKTGLVRARKAVQIMEYLKTTGGVLDYKALHAYVKADNAR